MAASKTEARRTVSESLCLALGRGLRESIEGGGEMGARWQETNDGVGRLTTREMRVGGGEYEYSLAL